MSAIEMDTVSQQEAYSLLSKAECIFAAIWHNPEGTIATEAIAQYYQVSTEHLLDILNLHHEEIGVTADTWTPRAAIRIGLLLTSPIATSVRSLALDVIEAYKQPTKRTSIRYLLENTQFVEWSDMTISRILECARTEVGKIRRELEANGNILQFKKRKHVRSGKEVERENEDSSPLTVGTDSEQHSNPDSTVVNVYPERSRRVKVSSQSHLRFGQEGVIVKESPGHWQKVIRFDDGEEVAIADTDLLILNANSCKEVGAGEGQGENFSSNSPTPPLPHSPTPPVERTYSPEYIEAIAQLKQQHQQELARLEEEIRIKLQTEAQEAAAQRLADELAAKDAIAHGLKEKAIALQKKVDELESLRKLETENQQLRQRIQDLENANLPRPDWNNTFTKQAEKVLNQEVKKAIQQPLFAPYDLKKLAKSPPENTPECLRLMGMALGSIASAMNNTQALLAAAALFNCQPTQSAIAHRLEQEQLIDEAAADIKSVLASPNCTWDDFWKVAQEYEEIKKQYWRLLTEEERSLVRALTEQRAGGRRQEAGGRRQKAGGKEDSEQKLSSLAHSTASMEADNTLNTPSALCPLPSAFCLNQRGF